METLPLSRTRAMGEQDHNMFVCSSLPWCCLKTCISRISPRFLTTVSSTQFDLLTRKNSPRWTFNELFSDYLLMLTHKNTVTTSLFFLTTISESFAQMDRPLVFIVWAITFLCNYSISVPFHKINHLFTGSSYIHAVKNNFVSFYLKRVYSQFTQWQL